MSGSDDYRIKIWYIQIGQAIKTIFGHQSFVKSILFSHDERFIISGSWDHTVKVFNVEKGK